MGTFSFYFSHHISTIEGGMLVTDDPGLADLARMLRAHGWTRDVKKKPAIVNAPIDERFLFVNLGYTLRPMELQGAFGLHQVAKLEPFIKIRRDNVDYWNAGLRRHARWLRRSWRVLGAARLIRIAQGRAERLARFNRKQVLKADDWMDQSLPF